MGKKKDSAEKAIRDIRRANRVIGAFMQTYDIILSPTLGIVPPEVGYLSIGLEPEVANKRALPGIAFTSLYNITGQPAMSVPLHWTASDIPIGVMFAGRMGDEATLFRLASQLEEAAPWFDRVPTI